MSGREVFEFRPELVDDDDAEADDTEYDKNKEDEEEVNDLLAAEKHFLLIHFLFSNYIARRVLYHSSICIMFYTSSINIPHFF